MENNRKISRKLIEFMADKVWDRLIEEYGERFSDVIYMAMEDPDVGEEMKRLDEEHYHKLSSAVMREIGKGFNDY